MPDVATLLADLRERVRALDERVDDAREASLTSPASRSVLPS